MRLKVLAQETLPATTEKTVPAEFGVICADTVAHRELSDVFTEGDDLSDSFVAGDEGELEGSGRVRRGETFAMNSPSWMWRSVPQTPHARTALGRELRGYDTFNKDVVVPYDGEGNFPYTVLPRSIIPKRFHRSRQSHCSICRTYK
jgi:hypothetical protein